VDIDVPQPPFDNSRADISTNGAEVSSLENVEVDIELGDMGLRYRSADSTSDKKDESRARSSKVTC
jgi:hypothetical protein